MSNNIDQLALRAILVLASMIALVFGLWWFVPAIQEKVSKLSLPNFWTESKSPPSPAETQVARAPKPVATPEPKVSPAKPKPSPKSRAIAKKSSTPEPEVRKAVPVAKPSAIFSPAPTPVALDWQGRPWVNRHASDYVSSNSSQDVQIPNAPTPSAIEVAIVPKRWSKLVSVPPNRRAFVTFSVGRMRVEADGIDRGIFFRQPTVTVKKNTPHVWEGSIRPFATFDQTPGLLEFERGTRTLRFLSLEKGAETVSVEFR